MNSVGGPIPSQTSSVDDVIQADAIKEQATDAATAAEQTETEQADSLLDDAESNTTAGSKAESKKLQPKEFESRVKKTTEGESVLVSIEEGEFESFNSKGNNSKYMLPQKKFTDLAKELKPGDEPDKILDLVITHLPSSEHDPKVIYKSFDYLIQVVTAKIEKAKTKLDQTSLQELRENIGIAKQTYYNSNKKIIDSTTEEFMEIASKSVDMREREALADLAETITPELKNLKPDDVTRKVQNLVPDSKLTTVDKEFDALLEHIENKIADKEISPTDKKDLQTIQQTVNQAKVEFGKLHATELKLAADNSKPLKDVLMKMRDIVFNNPQTVFDKARKYSTDPNGYKGMIKEANDLFHFIGSLVKDAKLENTELGRIVEECKTLQAAKQIPLQIEKNIPSHERRLATMGVIE
jgi:hypothetical protein